MPLWGVRILRASFWMPGTHCPHCCCGSCQAGTQSQRVASEAGGWAGRAMADPREGKGHHWWGQRWTRTKYKDEEKEVGPGRTVTNCGQGFFPWSLTSQRSTQWESHGGLAKVLRLVVTIPPENGWGGGFPSEIFSGCFSLSHDKAPPGQAQLK